MRRPPPPLRATLALLGFLGLLALAACARPTINLDRDNRLDGSDDGELQTISPYGFVDRWGEPDIWRNEGDTKGGLTMVQIWRCAQGRYREVTWRMVQRQEQGMSWTIVNDINRNGLCDEPGQHPPKDSEEAADTPEAPSADAPEAADTPDETESGAGSDSTSAGGSD